MKKNEYLDEDFHQLVESFKKRFGVDSVEFNTEVPSEKNHFLFIARLYKGAVAISGINYSLEGKGSTETEARKDLLRKILV